MKYEYYYTDDVARKMDEIRQNNNKLENIGLIIPAVVLGVASLVLFLFGINLLMAAISIIMAILFLAANVRMGKKRGTGLAIIAIVTSVLSVVLFFGSWALIMTNFDNLAPMIEEEFENNPNIEFNYNNNYWDTDDTL